MTDGVVESVYTEVLAVVAATPAQVESVYTETLGKPAATPAQVESLYTETLGKPAATPAQVESLYTEVLVPVFEPDRARFLIGATDIPPVVLENALFRIGSSEYIAPLGGDLWIPTTQALASTLVWLPDPPPSLELPSEGAWGLIVAINH